MNGQHWNCLRSLINMYERLIGQAVCQIPQPKGLGIWLSVFHAPLCIVTTNPSRASLNPSNIYIGPISHNYIIYSRELQKNSIVATVLECNYCKSWLNQNLHSVFGMFSIMPESYQELWQLVMRSTFSLITFTDSTRSYWSEFVNSTRRRRIKITLSGLLSNSITANYDLTSTSPDEISPSFKTMYFCEEWSFVELRFFQRIF